MDSVADLEVLQPLEVRSDDLTASVGDKRPPENGQLEARSLKKAKNGDQLLGGDIKKVAEVVLVLATMGKIRGGRTPTSAEMEMMAHARAKLVEVCQEFAPKDVFPRDAFGAVIEDLGLTKSREQKLGFRPRKMSIAEKLNLTKQKMEKSEEFALRSATYTSQRLQANASPATESRGTSQAVKIFGSEKPSHAPASGGLQPASPLGHVSAANSTPLPYQLPTSEVRPMVSSGLTSSDLGRSSSSLVLPRADRPHFRLDGKSNGVSYTSQVQVNSSGDHTKTPTWSVQPQPTLSAKVVSDGKVPVPVKVEEAADMSRIASQATSSKPVLTQITTTIPRGIHPHVQQGMKVVQAPSISSSHNEIGKIVQKLLQPRPPEHPIWTPPSRDYMNKALACQTCKLIINEVDNVLVCDACEKGYHLNCLQLHNLKSIPRTDWHCGKCLSLTNGKPLPPKYGRVTRNTTIPKVSSNATAIQLSLEKNVGTPDGKVSLQIVTANGNCGIQGGPTGTVDNISNNFPAGLEMADVRVTQRNDTLSTKVKTVEENPSGSGANNLMKTMGAACVNPTDLAVEISYEIKLGAEAKPQHAAKSETDTNILALSQSLGHPLDSEQKWRPDSKGNSSKQCSETSSKLKELEKSFGEELDRGTTDEAKKDEHGVSLANHVETTGAIGPKEHVESLADGLHTVEWTGDILRVVDDRTYYQSCSINAVVYKVQDYALFRSSSNILTPFKLQGMWEDGKTRLKWVVASRCYFPADLPEAVGRPCAPESNEVYESNHDTTVRAGFIEGPCEVLPPRPFFEESQRRSLVRMEGSDGPHPLFICKWFYDEQKGLFRAVTS